MRRRSRLLCFFASALGFSKGNYVNVTDSTNFVCVLTMFAIFNSRISIIACRVRLRLVYL